MVTCQLPEIRAAREGAVGEGEAGQALLGVALWRAARLEKGEVTTRRQKGS